MSKSTEIAKTSPLEAIISNPEQLKEIPVDTVERLFALHKEHLADQAKREFNQAFNAAQKDLVAVAKKGYNLHTKSKYALMEDIVAMLDPIVTEHGFSRSISTQPCDIPDHMRMVLTVRHVGGHNEEHMMDAPIDDKTQGGKSNKTRIQGQGSTYTYVTRYLLCNVFGIHLGDDTDGNKVESAEVITEEQNVEIQDLLDQTKSDLKKFLDYFQRNSIADMTEPEYKRAITMLKKKL